MILGIYGAGGLGKEVYELASIINAKKNRWEQIIFIDDSSSNTNKSRIPIFSFSEIKNKFPDDNLEVCIAVGEPDIRELLFSKLESNNTSIATLIHPEIDIPESTKIGKGTIICKFVSISCDINIGINIAF